MLVGQVHLQSREQLNTLPDADRALGAQSSIRTAHNAVAGAKRCFGEEFVIAD